MRKVYLNGNIDISRYVISIAAIAQTAADYGQMVINDVTSIVGDNTQRFWDTLNDASPFYGAQPISQADLYYTFLITIQIDGITIFNGYIKNISSDQSTRQATVNLISNMQRIMDGGILYASDVPDTPSNIVKAILIQYNIPYDASSFAAANSVYTANNVQFEICYQQPYTTIMSAIQSLASLGCARIYAINGIIYYDVFIPQTSNPIYIFSDQHSGPIGIWGEPQIQIIEKQIFKSYSITYVATNAMLAPDSIDTGTAISGDPNLQGQQLSGGYSDPARIIGLQSAVWIGLQWITYSNLLQYRITFKIDLRLGRQLAIGYPVIFQYKNITKIVDITSIDNSNKVYSILIGNTR